MTIMQHESPILPNRSPELEELLVGFEKLEDVIVLSDFDHTLCHKYSFDPSSNDHIPNIHPAIVSAASKQHLVVATGRRAESAALMHIWDDGLVPENRPIIAENGGVLVYNNDGDPRYLDLAPDYVPAAINEFKNILENDVKVPFPNKDLVVKLGRTMLIVRLQDAQGATTTEDQDWLQEQITRVLPDPTLGVVDNRVSIGVQHRDISKMSAFWYYLNTCGIGRDEILLVGMGDGENDQEIFNASDVRIGFSSIVKSMVDVCFDGTPEATATALYHVNNRPI